MLSGFGKTLVFLIFFNETAQKPNAVCRKNAYTYLIKSHSTKMTSVSELFELWHSSVKMLVLWEWCKEISGWDLILKCSTILLVEFAYIKIYQHI